MNKALAIYIDELRKPSSVAFCLDYSGSMYGSGEEELKNAMKYILNKDEASKDLLQFSENDLITVIPFNSHNYEILKSKSGTDTVDLIHTIEGITPGGGTNIYAQRGPDRHRLFTADDHRPAQREPCAGDQLHHPKPEDHG